MLYKKAFGLFFLFAIAAGSQVSYAQLPKTPPARPGSLDGSVVNEAGTPVSGAQILWEESGGGKPHVLHTDTQGHFGVPKLRSGLYDLRASKQQAESSWAHNVVVRAGRPTSITLRLMNVRAPEVQVPLPPN